MSLSLHGAWSSGTSSLQYELSHFDFSNLFSECFSSICLSHPLSFKTNEEKNRIIHSLSLLLLLFPISQCDVHPFWPRQHVFCDGELMHFNYFKFGFEQFQESLRWWNVGKLYGCRKREREKMNVKFVERIAITFSFLDRLKEKLFWLKDTFILCALGQRAGWLAAW